MSQAAPDRDMPAREALARHFGFADFRPGQQAAIQLATAGRDVLAVMPTGWGKSLIYQLAALMLPGTAVVISPLVALMKDQADSLMRRDIAAAFINSSLDAAEQSRRLKAMADGAYKIVLVAPERLRSRAFLDALRHVSTSLLVVDEAHCISQWGHDFRPDYLHIADLHRALRGAAAERGAPAPPLLALTATATPRVRDDMARMLGVPRAERVVLGFDRPNLTFEVFTALDAAGKLRFVRDFLSAGSGPEAGIVYTGTRREAEEVAGFIRAELRLDARHYHAALDSQARAETQDAFLSGDLPIIVATNAFGMGIDRSDVRFVLHYSLPSTLEAYYQEAGRAGRDGLPARAVLLYAPRDIALQQYFIDGDSPTEDELRAVHAAARAALGGGAELSQADFQHATGLPEIKVRVALEQLEAAGALRRGPDGRRGQLQIELLPIPEPALQAVAAQAAGRRDDKRRQLARMAAYAETEGCRRRLLLDHFGDASDSDAPLCCDNCLAQARSAAEDAAPAAATPIAALTQAQRAALIVLDAVATLRWTVGRDKLAHLLKGSQAKDMAQAGYTGNRNFGKFAALRLREIEALIDQLAEGGYLKPVGGDRPTLALSRRGEAALKNRAAIDATLRAVGPDAARRAKAERAAGGTVGLTAELLAQGLSVEQIAAQRGLVPGTIYTHLAQLIEAGRASIDQAVPAEVQRQVRAAIEAEGTASRLTPIKMRLADDIDYGVIRCVAAAWRLEHGDTERADTDSTDHTDEAKTSLLRSIDHHTHCG